MHMPYQYVTLIREYKTIYNNNFPQLNHTQTEKISVVKLHRITALALWHIQKTLSDRFVSHPFIRVRSIYLLNRFNADSYILDSSFSFTR